MKTDCYFDSEAESFDSDSEFEIEIIEKPENQIENINIIKSICNTLSTIIEETRKYQDILRKKLRQWLDKENKKLPNYKEILKKQSHICFNSNSLPNITLYEYIIRIQKYSFIEKSTLILSLIYIDRFCKLGKIMLTYYNIHRIIFAALLLAIKYNEDRFFENEYYSKIAGIQNDELKNIEYNFFCICDFNMYVSDEIFDKYNKYLNNIDENELDKPIKTLFLDKE